MMLSVFRSLQGEHSVALLGFRHELFMKKSSFDLKHSLVKSSSRWKHVQA